jgi:hypothetical protein
MGHLTLNNVTVRGNTAVLGGGMFIAAGAPASPAPVVTLGNSTITGNTAGASGRRS